MLGTIHALGRKIDMNGAEREKGQKSTKKTQVNQLKLKSQEQLSQNV